LLDTNSNTILDSNFDKVGVSVNGKLYFPQWVDIEDFN
jgi:hypothetical protein